MTTPADPWAPPAEHAPDHPEARRRRRRRAAVAMTSVVAGLLALLVGSSVIEDRRAERLRAGVAAVLPELRAFVEQERGLPFLEEVDVEVLGDDAFLEALYAEPEDAPEPREDRDAERTLTALGLLADDVDLDEAVGESLDEGVVGFYDAQTGRLAVRGREVDAFVQLVLVHELVHALQDQHFDIDRPELDEADDERSAAFTALVEGDAVRVELAWLEAQPRSVQDELLDAFGGESSGGEPVVEALLGFPYAAGPGLAQALVDRGGQEELDAAFRDPPTTTEQVVDPAAGPAVEVLRPAVEGDVVDVGVLGLLGLALLLDVDPLEPGAERGWAGDSYVTAETGDRTCTTVHLAADDDDARTGLDEALRSTRPDLEVGPGPDGTLRVVGCAS